MCVRVRDDDDDSDNSFSGNRSALEDDKGVDHHTAVGEKMSELERNQDEEEERRKERAQALVRDKLIAVEVKGQPTYKTFIKYSFANLQVASRGKNDFTLLLSY